VFHIVVNCGHRLIEQARRSLCIELEIFWQGVLMGMPDLRDAAGNIRRFKAGNLGGSGAYMTGRPKYVEIKDLGETGEIFP
jgi:hypothetical protein